MKKVFLLTLAAALYLGVIISCTEDDDNNIEPLPPYTETGANTFTFRVDGKVYEAEVGYLPVSPKIHIFYNHIDTFLNNDYLFAITGNRIYLDDNKSVDININCMTKIGKYLLAEYESMGLGYYASYWDVEPVEKYYYTDSEHAGELNITRLDTINHIVAGKFKFKAKRWCLNEECAEVITVDGQFDVKYKPNIGVNYY